MKELGDRDFTCEEHTQVFNNYIFNEKVSLLLEPNLLSITTAIAWTIWEGFLNQIDVMLSTIIWMYNSLSIPVL